MDIKKELKRVLNIFLIAAAILAFTGAALAASFYFLVYLEPNFNNAEINYLKSTGPREIRPGGEMNVELSYGNSGYREVRDFSVEFFIPQHAKLKVTSQAGKYDADKNSIIFESKSLKKDESRKILITLTADSPLDDATAISIKDLRTVYSLSGKILEGEIKSDSIFEIKSSPDIIMGNMELKDKDGGDINMGDEISFGFSAVNKGDMNATGVLITAKIPEKTTLIEGSISPEGYEIKDGSIVWNLGSMAINHDFNFKYSLEVQEGFTDYEKITGSASLKSGQGQEASIRAEGEVRLFPDLGSSTVSMNDKDGGNLWAGDKVVVKAVLANDGERSAEQVILNCPVPENSSYVKGSATCRDAEISFDNNKVIFVIPEIKPGESSEAVFEIQVSPKMSSGGAIDASFDLSANGIEFVLPDSEIKVKANYQVTVACLGDSLIALSNWPQILDSLLEATYAHSDYNIIASGIKGEMAPGGYNRFDDSIAKYKPQIVIVGYGTNDIGSGTDKFSHYLSAIVQKIKNINATPFIESLGYINVNMEPLKADWASYQSVIYQTGDFYNVPVIDIYSPLSSDPGTYIADWVHYTPEGSSVVAHTIYNYIVRYLDSEGRRK